MATIVTRSGKGSPLTHAEVDANFTNLNTDKLELSGGTMTGNLSFGDNDKAIFGAGSDLQIYHNGTNSDIDEVGTGNLRIGAQNFVVQNADHTENMISATPNGQVVLYYDNSIKFNTSSTGIDVSGTVTADGLTVDGASQFNTGASGIAEFYHSSGYGGVKVTGGATGSGATVYLSNDKLGTPFDIYTLFADGADDSFKLYSGGNQSSGTLRFKSANNGDISFYEDTGTTAKFFWDASAESLGIGTGSPSAPLTVQTSATTNVDIKTSATNGTAQLRFSNDARTYSLGIDNNDSFFVYDATGTSTRMTIDSSGNVGIGTSSPTTALHVLSGTGNSDVAIFSGANASRGLKISTLQGGAQDEGVDFDAHAGSTAFHTFSINGTERMRIDSSGNVGIGVVPENWYTGNNVLAIGSAAYMYGSTNTSLAAFGVNSYYDLTDNRWEYTNSDYASRYYQIDGQHIWETAPSGTADAALTWSEAMRIDSSGNLLVGKTSIGLSTTGIDLRSTGLLQAIRNGGTVVELNRQTSDGTIIDFRKDNTTVGSIGSRASDSYISLGNAGLTGSGTGGGALLPTTGGTTYVDNVVDLGFASGRFDDIYATNGTIQTSDRNEKQDIAELTDAEQRVAVAAKGLLRKFRWKDAVAEKGDEARTHFGIIAQDLQAAFAAEGLDAGSYAMFIHTTWNDEETGEERSRMGVRYSELLAFIIAAI